MNNTTAVKQLRRSRTNRKIAGVCAGVANYFGVDPNAVRLAFVLVVLFTGGWVLLAYPIAWMLIPEDEPQPAWQPVPPADPMMSGWPTDHGQQTS